MKKQCVLYVAVLTLFAFVTIIPVSAVTSTNPNGTVIERSATLFIGEQGLNMTHALNQAAFQAGIATTANVDTIPTNFTVGWWASAASITSTAPSAKVDLEPGYKSFTVDQQSFVGYTGNWYLLGSDKASPVLDAGRNPVAVFTVQDPSLTMTIWDYTRGTNAVGSAGTDGSDVNGKSLWRGDALGFRISTNQHPATNEKRNNTVYTAHFAPAIPANHVTAIKDGTFAYTGPTDLFPTESANMATQVSLVVQFNGTAIKTTYRDLLYGAYNYSYWNATSGTWNTSANGLGDASQWVNWNLGTRYPLSSAVMTQQAATDGYVTIRIKNPEGAVYSRLKCNTTASSTPVDTDLSNQFVNNTPWFFGSSQTYWVTDARDANDQFLYPVGEYTYWAESELNGMKDNYKNAGADYTGKTVSASGTFKFSSFPVKIEAKKDSVVRSKRFAVTVTGRPSSYYYIWVKGTSLMTSEYDDQPPMILPNQESVSLDDEVKAGAAVPVHPYGDYQYENGDGEIIFNDVAASTNTTANRTRYYARIKTSGSGTRLVEFVTTNMTRAQKYTIRVEAKLDGTYWSDETDISVEQGVVTITAAGDQSYYLGEEIKFSGTNTETYKTYLFLVGPNLPEEGAQISPDDKDPRSHAVVNNDASTFRQVDVNGDDTWSWKWGTASYALDAGTYTIYAVSQPYSRSGTNLANAAYGTVSLIIRKPFVSATASQSAVAKGDSIFVTGSAEGDPSTVYIWILGKNYATQNIAPVKSDTSFEYEIAQDATRDLTSGQYFVIVQHPMQNKDFDIDYDADTGYVFNRQLQAQGSTDPMNIFKLTGAGSLQGTDAAEALAEGINDPNIDDTYTKLQFLIEEPDITIDTIGDRHIGEKFSITAKTNLAVDDDILVQVYSSSFKPTMKSQSGEFSGAAGSVKVTKGDSGYNTISFDVDSSTFRPDEYIVTEDAVLQEATGTALFNVLETSAKTVAPATTATAVQTPVLTTVQTPGQTSVPTATPAKSPGFGALVALMGMGAGVLVVVRRQ